MLNVKINILQYVQMEQLIWFGDVKRMDDKRLPQSAVDFNPSQKRKIGKPRKIWKKDINKALEEFAPEWSSNRKL